MTCHKELKMFPLDSHQDILEINHKIPLVDGANANIVRCYNNSDSN